MREAQAAREAREAEAAKEEIRQAMEEQQARIAQLQAELVLKEKEREVVEIDIVDRVKSMQAELEAQREAYEEERVAAQAARNAARQAQKEAELREAEKQAALQEADDARMTTAAALKAMEAKTTSTDLRSAQSLVGMSLVAGGAWIASNRRAERTLAQVSVENEVKVKDLETKVEKSQERMYAQREVTEQLQRKLDASQLAAEEAQEAANVAAEKELEAQKARDAMVLANTASDAEKRRVLAELDATQRAKLAADAEATAKATEAAELTAKLTALTRTELQIRAQNAELDQKYRATTALVREERLQKDKISERLAEARKELMVANADSAQQRAAIAKLETEIESLQAREVQLLAQISTAEKMVRKLTVQAREDRASTERTVAQLAAARQELDRANGDASMARSAKAALEATISALEDQVQREMEARRALEPQLQNALIKVREESRALDKVTAQLVTARSEREVANADSVARRADIDGLQQAIARLTKAEEEARMQAQVFEQKYVVKKQEAEQERLA